MCLSCNVSKPFSEFQKDVHGFKQKKARCRDCCNILSRKNYQENPNVRRSGIKNRPDKLKRLYGVTYEQVVQTLSKQLGRCANIGCSKEISLEVNGTRGNRAVIDHDHKTGEFRAVLCMRCNTLLGSLETESDKILGLLDYLNKHKNNKKL